MAAGDSPPDNSSPTPTGSGPRDHPRIPSAIEEQVLDILDRTDPGAEREAALGGLGMTAEVETAVRAWLAEDDDHGSTFLQTPLDTRVGSPAPDTGFAANPASLPRRLGDYELFDLLGKGGMGIVYAARDLKLGREVALKVLPEHFADHPKRLQRFAREVRAVAALRHHNIISVLEAGTLEGTPYFTMELVDGQSLDKVIHRLQQTGNPLAALRRRHWLQAVAGTDLRATAGGRDRTYIEVVCRLTIDIADALQHAHDHRIIHRDVKPSNIMVLRTGGARLFDFGLARREDDGVVTRTSELIGSPHYMSPEQVSGRDLDHRSDIYSLGVTLYELLTLRVPFEGTSAQQLYQTILSQEPRRPSLFNPQLPKDLETICLTATEKRAERRYATADEFAEDLRRFLRFEPVQARPIGNVTRSIRWLRRNRAAASIATLLLAVVITLLVTIDTTQQKNEAQVESKRLEGEVTKIESQLADLELARRTAQGEIDLTRAQTAAAQQKLEAAKAALLDRGDALRRINDELAAQRQALANQQQLAGTLTAEKAKLEAQKAELEGSLQHQLRQQAELATRLAQLTAEVSTQTSTLDRAQAELGTLQQNHFITTINRLLMEARLLREENPGLGLIIAHEAAQQAVQAADAIEPQLQTRIDDTLLALLRTTNEQITFTGHQHPATSVAYSPNGARLVSASSHGTVHVWSRHTGRSIVQIRQPAAVVHVEYVTEDLVLLARESGELVLWNTGSDAPPSTLEFFRHRRDVRRHVSPDGRSVVGHVDDADGGLRVTWLGQDTPPQPLGTAGTRFSGFRFSPTGTAIVAITADSRVQVIDLETTREVASRRASAMPLDAAFDAVGRRVAWAEANGSVKVMSILDAAILLEVKINDGAPLGTGRIAFCDEDQSLLVTGTGARSHLLLDVLDGSEVARIPAAGDLREFTLDSGQGHLACIPTRAGRFRVLNTRNGHLLAELNGHAEDASPHPPHIAFSPVGLELATVHGDTTVRIWRARPGGSLTSIGPWYADHRASARREQLQHARLDADGHHLLTVSDLGVSRWHLRSGRRVASFAQDPRLPTPASLLAADGSHAVLLQGGRVLHTRAAAAAVFELHDVDRRDIEHVTCWPGGRIALTLSPSPDDPLRQFRLVGPGGGSGGAPGGGSGGGPGGGSVDGPGARFSLPGGAAGGGIPTASPDGRRLVVGHVELRLIDTVLPERVLRLPFSQHPVAFSPDGRWLAASTGFGVRVFDAATGRVHCDLAALPVDYSQLTCLVFSPDNRRLATGWSDGAIRMHDCHDAPGRRLFAITPHRLRLRSLCFDKAGRMLLSAADDHKVRIVHSADGQAKVTFDAGAPCVEAGFGAGDREVLCVCADAVHLFPVEPRARAAQACPRQMTAEERRRLGL